ncbi:MULTISPECIES: 16S rRNA (uracil(1498)-N(3))-methyltransferase [Gracilibacillus]|uniref:16S rRNA (uracil(1498)-N(3))-methyltransferase n=1 Tax=Gracilibacillus TaxID=74385 RepID=UPI0008268583|nr:MULTISPECIES: 16S rRNA (uracil(1498)-N(3))-methyltransferase [Gracilibacillus]
MQRYFIEANNWQEQTLIVDGEDFHHIVHVMRMKPGESFIASQNNGQAAVCEVMSITDETIEARVKEWLNETVELPVSVTIAQGIPKGDKWETILQKGTELGASSFIPFQADRSVAKWDQKKVVKKLDRWRKIVKEASEQSHRNVIPSVDEVISVQQLIDRRSMYDCCLFAYEEETRTSNSQTFDYYLSKLKQAENVLLCIGPEGGFSQAEAEALKQSGFSAVRLGPRILRTETASLYALSCISYKFEEMQGQ